ncbi:MAG TPA: bacteriohopanetetrol glucosamine biosynthesis glycosyltransferase HpnI [Novosphingobium sp.]|nr:bacteriohopanetetrol glucosamine biosynthesis glycosyltransferase HpnI [Novosphingobium sp.]
MTLSDVAVLILAAMAAVGVVYQLGACVALVRFFGREMPVARDLPADMAPKMHGVTLVKPLHGAEPRLAENLATFLDQDTLAAVQMLCGVNTAQDAAASAVAALRASHPQADIAFYPGPRLPGANGKMGNCAAMLPLARHDVLLLSDSDMVVERDYLARVVGALQQPGVGAVSCLYVGRGDSGLWSRIGAAMISWQTMPNMVVGMATGMAQPCMGSTIALRRSTLDAIGGFESLVDVLADDHAIGARVAALGQKVVIPPMLLVHAGAEGSARALWRQHLRWAATVRDLAGPGHYGSVITHPLALSLLVVPFAPLGGLFLVGAALIARIALARVVNRLAPPPHLSLWALPVADVFAFAIFCASLFTRQIDWRGASLTMTGNGRIAPDGTRN